MGTQIRGTIGFVAWNVRVGLVVIRRATDWEREARNARQASPVMSCHTLRQLHGKIGLRFWRGLERERSVWAWSRARRCVGPKQI